MTEFQDLSDTIIYSKPYITLAISGLLTNTVMGIFFVLPLFILHIGGNKTDIGILMGVMSLSAVLCRPWTSHLVDRIGRKKSFAIGCILISVVSFLHIFFQGDIDAIFAVLLALRLFLGIGWSLCIVGIYTLITDIIPKTRFNEGIGMFGITGLIGIALGPLLAEWIIIHIGYTAMFLSAAIICILALAICMPIHDHYTYQIRQVKESFFKTFMYPQTMQNTLIAFLFGIGFSAHVSFVAPFAQSKGLRVSNYFIAYSAAAILSRIIGGRFADRFGERRIVPFALLLTGLGFASIMTADSVKGLLVTGFITGFGHGMLIPCILTLAIRSVPSYKRGLANGVFTGGLDGGVFCGSIVMGYIAQRYGFDLIFIIAGIALLAGFVVNRSWKIR